MRAWADRAADSDEAEDLEGPVVLVDPAVQTWRAEAVHVVVEDLAVLVAVDAEAAVDPVVRADAAVDVAGRGLLGTGMATRPLSGIVRREIIIV
jgi:hypothetical protein